MPEIPDSSNNGDGGQFERRRSGDILVSAIGSNRMPEMQDKFDKADAGHYLYTEMVANSNAEDVGTVLIYGDGGGFRLIYRRCEPTRIF